MPVSCVRYTIFVGLFDVAGSLDVLELDTMCGPPSDPVLINF
jgi:hypothetical protein